MQVDDNGKYAYNFETKENAGVVQLVECLLAKEKVVGSSPIARSTPLTRGVFLSISGGSGKVQVPG